VDAPHLRGEDVSGAHLAGVVQCGGHEEQQATKAAGLAEPATRTRARLNSEPFLLKKAGGLFYDTSQSDLKTIVGDQDHIGENPHGPTGVPARSARHLRALRLLHRNRPTGAGNLL
jgi:hypothetical protein